MYFEKTGNEDCFVDSVAYRKEEVEKKTQILLALRLEASRAIKSSIRYNLNKGLIVDREIAVLCDIKQSKTNITYAQNQDRWVTVGEQTKGCFTILFC